MCSRSRLLNATGLFLLLDAASVFKTVLAAPIVYINEIADKGSSEVCSGNDWLEIYNEGPETVNLTGFVLHDDNGIGDEDAFSFPALDMSVLDPGTYLLLCTKGEDTLTSPQFKIGGDDTVSLVNMTANGEIILSSVSLPDSEIANFDVTYARSSSSDGSFQYTATPTPGYANELSPVTVKKEEEEPKVVSSVYINEISDKGSSDVCSGNDWIEIFNEGPETVNLAGFVLHDDNGIGDENAFSFPALDMSVLGPGTYLLLCTQGDNPLTSPQFKIGGDDTVSLVNTTTAYVDTTAYVEATLGTPASDAGKVVDKVGPLPDGEGAGFDVTYARNPSDGSFQYTTTPTPGYANELSPVIPPETPTERLERLARQNEEGTRFFGMDERGYPVENPYDEVLDFYMTLDEDDYEYLRENPIYETYVPFQSARIVQSSDNTELLSLQSPGRIRTKGQTSLYFPICLGVPSIPFQIDFDHTNSSQTLFGVERVYLRNHFGDFSYIRDWSANRMLARFGLPHLRARSVRFYINGEKRGLYTMLEAQEQEYVFARHFPGYDHENYALFKMKTFSGACGWYDEEELAAANARLNETTTPPYSFQRGVHRDKVPVRGMFGAPQCAIETSNDIYAQKEDSAIAYLRYDRDCGTMLLDTGLVDRDLGKKKMDSDMEIFISEHLADNECDPGCPNSDLSSDVDVENFLKNIAVYAVTLNDDSPLGSGNNYYLANAGDGKGWKLVAYDFHSLGASYQCDGLTCNQHLIYWSIMRPTCEALEYNQLAGPLLTNPTYHKQYIEYVRSFVDTVLGNESFVDEMSRHAQAMEDDVSEDPMCFWGLFYYQELSPDAASWDAGLEWAPFLPFLKAREEQVREQLAAIDAGTFPRGPHLDVGVDPGETCVDWRSQQSSVAAGAAFSRQKNAAETSSPLASGWAEAFSSIASSAPDSTGGSAPGEPPLQLSTGTSPSWRVTTVGGGAIIAVCLLVGSVIFW